MYGSIVAKNKMETKLYSLYNPMLVSPLRSYVYSVHMCSASSQRSLIWLNNVCAINLKSLPFNQKTDKFYRSITDFSHFSDTCKAQLFELIWLERNTQNNFAVFTHRITLNKLNKLLLNIDSSNGRTMTWLMLYKFKYWRRELATRFMLEFIKLFVR